MHTGLGRCELGGIETHDQGLYCLCLMSSRDHREEKSCLKDSRGLDTGEFMNTMKRLFSFAN